MNRLFFIVCIVLASCEVVVDVDVPVKDPSITVYANLNPDSLVKVQLTESQHVLSESEFRFIESAQVTLYRDGEVAETLNEIFPGIYEGTSVAQPGANYRLEINKNGFRSVNSEVVVPDLKASIDDVNYVHLNKGEFALGEFQFTVEITDGEGPNYYELSLLGPSYNWQYDPETGERQITDTTLVHYWIESEDPIFTEQYYWNPGLLFNDSFIEGKKARLKFTTYVNTFFDSSEQSVELVIVLRELSESMYNHEVTAMLQANAEGDPFAEPAPVYGNIQNGFGVFGAYNQVTKTVIIEPEE